MSQYTEALFANLFLSLDSHLVDVPLLVFRRVVDRLVFADVVRDVELVAVKRPRDEHDVALLVVKRKVLHVQSAVRLDDGRKHPQHLPARRHDRERVHKVLETVVSAARHTVEKLYSCYRWCFDNVIG